MPVFSPVLRRVAASCHTVAGRPEWLAFMPALTLAAFWLGGEAALVATALGVPALLALRSGLGGKASGEAQAVQRDAATGLALRPELEAFLDRHLAGSGDGAGAPGCIVLVLDGADALARRHGNAAFTALLVQTAQRVSGAVRHADLVARLDGACFAVGLAPFLRCDLETVLQVAARVQAAAEAEVAAGAVRIHPTASVGFCLALDPAERRGAALVDAAETAMDAARACGPGTIRAHTEEMRRLRSDSIALRNELAAALNSGEICAHFQPQLSTDTGEITGFEALVRWNHPRRGLLEPAAFLDALIATGLSERLGEVMLYHALGALRRWDIAGHRIAGVGVNFSAAELRQPSLPDRIAWELDRFDLAPDRLVVEILESVAGEDADNRLLENVARLGRMGCRIDLDDFGTGHASIANIRRFAAGRLKIDRSLVTGLHRDRERQDMVAAILSLSEQLGLETLAEGVECAGEHALLAQLGCDHVQGYAIARPMAVEATLGWIERHKAGLGSGPAPQHGVV